MTQKEKALELIDKYLQCVIFNIKQEIKVSVIDSAKQCALIAVNEILEALQKDKWNNDFWINYYKEVKQEINKL